MHEAEHMRSSSWHRGPTNIALTPGASLLLRCLREQEETRRKCWSGGLDVCVQPAAQFPLFPMMVTGYVGNRWQDAGISFVFSAVPEGFLTVINAL